MISVFANVRHAVGSMLVSDGTLAQKAVRGGFWVFALRITSRLFGLARTVVLARLLAPEDFGLFGIAMLAISTLQSLSQTGFTKALIQKQEETKSYLDTAWIVQVIRGAALALLLFGAAPYVAAFFGESKATLLLRAIAVSLLLQGLNSIGIVYFEKELEFNKQFVYQLSSTVADLGVSVTAAILLQNAWALMFGLLARNATELVMSYLLTDYRPRVRVDYEKARELFGYGRWVFLSSILSYLVSNLDSLVVGRLLELTAFGLYQMAFRLSQMAATEITKVVSQVAFPTYAKVQDDGTRMREAVVRTMSTVALVSIPLAGGMFVLAPELVMTLLGEKWLPMVPTFRLLCITAAVRSITANFGSVFLSVGRPDIQTKASMMNGLILGISLYPLITTFGMIGAVYSRFFTLVTQFYTWPRFLGILRLDFRDLARRVVVSPLLATLVMISVVGGLKSIVATENILEVLVLGTAGFIAYLGSAYALDDIFSSGHREDIESILWAIKGLASAEGN